MHDPILTAGPIARARNGVIGCDSRLPWRLKTDMASFRALTMGKPVIMGRKTWESLPRRPLAGRANIVFSRNASLELDGGASLFALALVQAQRIYLTEIDAEVAGDVVLPPIDERQWSEVRREIHPASADDDHRFVIRVLERRRGAG